MRKALLVLILLTISFISWSRQNKPSVFCLYYLSKEINTDARMLDSQVCKAKSLEEVRQLVAGKVTGKEGKIIVLFKKDGLLYRWEKRLGDKNAESIDNWIIAGVRGLDIPKVTDVRKFKVILKDTIVVIDSFKIMAAFNDPAFPASHYKLQYACGERVLSKEVAVLDGNILLFEYARLAACGRYTRVNLYNDYKDAGSISRFTIFVPAQQELCGWLLLSRRLQSYLNTSSIDEIAGYMTTYIQEKHGQCGIEQVRQWLTENL